MLNRMHTEHTMAEGSHTTHAVGAALGKDNKGVDITAVRNLVIIGSGPRHAAVTPRRRTQKTETAR